MIFSDLKIIKFRLNYKNDKNSPMTIRKGSKNVALRRDFAHFVIHDPLSINLLNYLQNTEIPDEHFYSTLVTVEWSKVKVSHSAIDQI